MRKFATALTASVLAWCQSASAQNNIPAQVSLDVSSYNVVSGEFKLLLRNHSPRDIYFLHYLLTFSSNPQPDDNAQPNFPRGEAVVFHEVLLKTGKSVEISGTCTREGLCTNAGVFAGVYTCWSNSRWQCNEYSMVWSAKPVNGP